jgi:vacuolar-type H+-ATPase subunit E/Vma4
MKANVSKSQMEVWEWKERLHEELKSVPEKERLKYIRNKVKNTVKQLKADKTDKKV